MNGGRAAGPTSAACGSQDACGCGAAFAGRAAANPLAGFSRTLLWAFGLIIAVVVPLVVAAEQLGVLDMPIWMPPFVQVDGRLWDPLVKCCLISG
ncbi:MAG: hypothetical protein RE468_04280 [Acidithiobacillus caldus]|uniref:Uncharacterized protein n=1 Tax=Acidithiobacillus caldus TaxID=33059 RepID=A0A1E7YKW6_9PROT|nr:hypothetical protein [Acidithiobacillus caldus]OFC30617.1 hypothetical protein BAE27_11445 [Acidithiobacillus caldus]OFC36504.1 hypothetical protein BAE29_12810 [Acidithiobacillus caldus]OFC37471.1 hypothetical protein BAE28_07140 [Acidithiobacillus caldus]WMT47836.1 MAG: hypothetical protein RE468_04280 [Acidithiobacillus caldus]